MANRLYNKQVSPKGYKAGGSVKEDPMRDRKKQPLKRKNFKDRDPDRKLLKQKQGRKFFEAKASGGRAGKMGGGMMMQRPMMQKGGSLKAVQPNQKGLKKLPTEVRNKMGYMKKGGVVSDAKKKQFKENKAGQKSFNKKAMKIAKGVLNFAVPAVGAAEVGKKIARKFKGAK